MSNDTPMLYSTVDDYIENIQRIFDQTHDRIQAHQKHINDAWEKDRKRLDKDESELDNLMGKRRQLIAELRNCLGKVETQKRQELGLRFQNMNGSP